jgi:hypothetical protein
MPYTKTIWKNNVAPPINEANLNKMEAGIKLGADHSEVDHAPSNAVAAGQAGDTHSGTSHAPSNATPDQDLSGKENVNVAQGLMTSHEEVHAPSDATPDQDLSGKENVNVAQGLMTTHEETHAPSNATPDQDLSGKENVNVAQGLMTTHEQTHAPSNATPDQDLSGKENVNVAQGLMTTHETTHAPSNATPDQDLSGLLPKSGGTVTGLSEAENIIDLTAGVTGTATLNYSAQGVTILANATETLLVLGTGWSVAGLKSMTIQLIGACANIDYTGMSSAVGYDILPGLTIVGPIQFELWRMTDGVGGDNFNIQQSVAE